MQEHIGRYELRRELGRGGMAAVYLAFDPLFRRQVAIKVMPRQFAFDPRYLERFQNEAHTIANLEHPAIVPVHDFGEHDDAPFLVMRYMSGGTLEDRMSKEPLSLDKVITILTRIAPALDKAHEMGVIHRDIKPANILFDDDGFPYLADFGIARLAEATQTMTVIGTPAYMSPEQVEGDVEPDSRSDIYSLGAMVYELLTGKQPYEGSTPTKQMMAHLLEPLPDILQDNPNLPPEVQQVIEKAMAKNRDERYATASALVDDLIAANAAGSGVAPVPAVPRGAKIAAASAAVSMADTPPAGQEQSVVFSAAPGVPPQTGSGMTPPPAAPPATEGASPRDSRIWIWGIGALLLLAAIVLGVLFVSGRNGEDAGEPDSVAVGAAAATDTPEPTPEPPTPTPEPPTPTASATPEPEEKAEVEAAASPIVLFVTATPEPPTPTSEIKATNTAVPSETPAPATPAAEPTASATPEPEIQVPQFVVGFESVNVRRGPGGVFRSIAIRYAGDVLEVIGRNADASWLVVSLGDGDSGWVFSEVGEFQAGESPLDIPLAATIPPWPTATNTAAPPPTARSVGTVTVTTAPTLQATIAATAVGTPAPLEE